MLLIVPQHDVYFDIFWCHKVTVSYCAPARPQHRGDTGGGQPPPTTVPPVQPSGLQEGSQRAPPGDQSVQDVDRAETATTGIGGDADHIREGVPRL